MTTKAQAGAIQEDVQGEEHTPLTMDSPEAPRNVAMEAINESRLRQLQEESGIDLLSDKSDEQVDEPLTEPEQAPEPEQQAAVKVKVDGNELEVTQDELVRAYQKNVAADRRLEEAARILRQAEEIAQQHAAAPTATPNTGITPEDLKSQAADVLSKLYDGDQDAATEALAQLITKAKGGDQPTPQPAMTQIDDEALTGKVLERIALNDAMSKVRTDYPDIINDPDLELLATIKVNRLVEQGSPRSKAILEVSEAMYKSMGKGRPPTDRAASIRQENKARLDNIPTASTVAAPSGSPQENSSPSSVIAEMARKRLGQSLAL